MKTTSVRKLLPDQWGFLCPVHTPDGGPCGLLSHLALKCKVLADAAVSGSKDSTLDDVLISLGVSPVCTHSESGVGGSSSVHLHLPVCVDGRVAGRLPARQMKTLAARLRRMKIEGDGSVPATLEIVCIPSGEFDPSFAYVSVCRLLSIYPDNCVSSPDILTTQLLSILYNSLLRCQRWTLSGPFPLFRRCSCNPTGAASSIRSS